MEIQKGVRNQMKNYQSTIDSLTDYVNSWKIVNNVNESVLTGKNLVKFTADLQSQSPPMFLSLVTETLVLYSGVGYSTEIKAKELAEHGYRWSGHTHPGYSDWVLHPSDGDIDILAEFDQPKSAIYNSFGDYLPFNNTKRRKKK